MFAFLFPTTNRGAHSSIQMTSLLIKISVIICVASARLPPRGGQQDDSANSWNWEVRHFTQTLDHTNAYRQGPSDTFAQRFILNQTFWKGAAKKGPIFFFTGAEAGEVVRIMGDYGNILDIASKVGGMVVGMEARFFGQSLPFVGNSSNLAGPGRIGTLSVEQMLMDYVEIISAVRDEFDPFGRCPTIAFGGSLAGTLAAMMRIRYPDIIDISLVSSAPLRGYNLPGVDQFAWRKRVTDTWDQLSIPVNCPIVQLVRRGFVALQKADPEIVKSAFGTCEAPYADNWVDVQDAVWSLLESQAEFVYPSSKSSIPNLCKAAATAAAEPSSSGVEIMARLLNASRTGCLNLTENKLKNQLPNSLGWSYLACTEVVHPIGCNNVTDFFPPAPWTLTFSDIECNATWGVRASDRGLWIPEIFGFNNPAKLASTTSRIIFTYGELDPWAVFAISDQPLSPELPVLRIPGGSHCADMASNVASDTKEMQKARGQRETIVKKWIDALQSLPRLSDELVHV